MKSKILKPILSIVLLFPSFAHSINWEMITVDNKKKQIEEYQGKWLVVNFWATWCPPCIEEIPELTNFYQNNKNNAIVLGINYENLEQKKLQNFIAEYFMEYPQFKLSPGELTPMGSISALPTTYVITPKGDVVAKQSGSVSEKMLSKFISSWEK